MCHIIGNPEARLQTSFHVREALHRKKSFLVFLTAASALFITLSLPPSDLGILGWFGLAPFLYAVRQRGMYPSGVLGFLFGCLFGIGAFSWSLQLAHISVANFLLYLIVFSLYFFIFALLYQLMSKFNGYWIIFCAPALWVTMEYCRSNLSFLSWPWNLLGHSQYLFLPVIQIADLAGVYGISFILFMVNELVSEAPDYLIRPRLSQTELSMPVSSKNQLKKHFAIVVFAVLLVISYGLHSMGKDDNNRHIRVALIQGNVLADNNMSYREKEEHLRVYGRLTRYAARHNPDLIVWPATSLPAPLKTSRLVRYTVSDLARETGAYLLVGGAGYEKVAPRKKGYQPYSNSEFLFTPSGHRIGQYNKIRLLPFNEYLPLQGKIRWPSWITTLKESFLRGDELTLFEVSGAKFGTPICWENEFPDHYRRFVRKGANFMVSVTNEGFLRSTIAPHQTLAMNIFRAVENKVAIVRATTTGISAFISPSGKIVQKVQNSNGKVLSLSGILVRNVPLSDRKTFYTLHGDIFAYITISLTLLFTGIAFYKRVRK